MAISNMSTTATHVPAGLIKYSIFILHFIGVSLTCFGQVATQVVVTTPPIAGPNGSLMSVQPVVQIEDASNNLVTTSTAQVQIVIASGTGGSIGGTTVINAVNGVAAFTDLTFTGIEGQSYTFEFESQPVIAFEPFAYTGGSTLTAVGARPPLHLAMGPTPDASWLQLPMPLIIQSGWRFWEIIHNRAEVSIVFV